MTPVARGRKKAISLGVSVLIAICVILMVCIGAFIGTTLNKGTTNTTVSTFAAQSTGTSISTVTASGHTVTELAFPTSCAKTYSNGTSGIKLYLSQSAGSSVSLCVRYFSYNPNGTTIHTLDQLTIFVPVSNNGSGSLRNDNSSFSISASTNEVQIGGPQLENEGYPVTYTINSTGRAPSGTYEIALSSGLYPDDVICAYGIYNTLQVGNVTNGIVTSSCHYIPSPQDNPGLVYSEVVGITNST